MENPGITSYNVSASPHIKDSSSTSDIMRDVLIAMLPTTVYGIWQFGLNSLIVVVLTVATAVLAEYLYQKFMKKPSTIRDLSAAVTGLILALNMPPEIPVWIPMLGAVFAIIVVKQFYGGIGQNWMNPALAARCFLLISFALRMTNFTSKRLGYDSLSGATPLAAQKQAADAISSATAGAASGGYTLMNMFIGRVPGTIGEVSKIALLIGAAYLLYKKVISLRIPLAYILTVIVFTFVFGNHTLTFVMGHLLGGGLIFGAFFMATDYTTTPITPSGQIIYGICVGILTSLFRMFGGSAEGVSYAIIIGNILYPLIEKMTIPKPFGRRAKA